MVKKIEFKIVKREEVEIGKCPNCKREIELRGNVANIFSVEEKEKKRIVHQRQIKEGILECVCRALLRKKVRKKNIYIL